MKLSITLMVTAWIAAALWPAAGMAQINVNSGQRVYGTFGARTLGGTLGAQDTISPFGARTIGAPIGSRPVGVAAHATQGFTYVGDYPTVVSLPYAGWPQLAPVAYPQSLASDVAAAGTDTRTNAVSVRRFVFQPEEAAAAQQAPLIAPQNGPSAFADEPLPRRAPPAPPTLTAGFVPPAPSPSAVSQRLEGLFANSGRIGALSPISVTLTGRIATLRGRVATPHDRRIAESIALLEPGVAQVVNELVVGEPAGDR